MHSEPIRHHYIPQFILKNFCFEEQHLHYFDKQTGCVSVKDTRDVFMVRNLYRDEINSSLDPVKIEKDLAEYEREVAPIMKERFLSEREIFLSAEEEAKIRLIWCVAIISQNGKMSSLLKIFPQKEADRIQCIIMAHFANSKYLLY